MGAASVLFLVSANNGLTQRAALTLRAVGHSVRTVVVDSAQDMWDAVEPADFDLILCPFLKAKIPSEIYHRWPTVIIHPGAVGDRGPSSIDWAITDSEPMWGVTALSAVEEMDAGPIWASRTFSMPVDMRKSAVYNGPTSDAAIACILETVTKSLDSEFRPTPLELATKPIPHARLRPLMTQRDRTFAWTDDAESIARRIRAADGFPGVLATVAGVPAYLYDVRVDRDVSASGAAGKVGTAAPPGAIVSRNHEAVRVACGTGSVWIGSLRSKAAGKNCKGPATTVLARTGVNIESITTERTPRHLDIRYQRFGHVGTVTFDFYNGAMSVNQCRRLTSALRYAAEQDTRVLVIRGDGPFFSNGIHLGTIEMADEPAQEGWANIKAINDVCRTILLATSQVTIAAFTGNAGAGGVMMPLGADVIAAREGVVLNPHYATMGLYGSELHTYTLPRRVGSTLAQRLTTECLPIDAAGAQDIGLVDEIGPRHDFDSWLAAFAAEHAADDRYPSILRAKTERLDTDFARKPLDAYELWELGEMSKDLFDDRNGFEDKRRNFIYKHGVPVAAPV